MNRRAYLTAVTSTGTLAIAGCTSLGGTPYTADAGEYLLPFDEVSRIIPGNLSGGEVEYEADDEVDSGRSYRFQEGLLAEHGLFVCNSVDDAENLYEDLVWDVDNTGASQGEERRLGDEAIYDEAAGSRILGIRLENIMIQMNGRAEYHDMERLTDAQIDRIENIG